MKRRRRGMKKLTYVEKLLPILYAAILSTAFFMSLVLLDTILEWKIALYTREAISHLVIIVVVLSVFIFLPGGYANWGLNLKNLKESLILGVISGLAFGILFSLFSYGQGISGWNFTRLMSQLGERENLGHLLSQMFLVGTSEELFFRGLLVTFLMRQYTRKLAGIHLGVIVVSVMCGLLQFYKLLFGAALQEILPFVFGGFIYALWLGWLYQRTGSLLGSIIAHNLGNSLMFAAGLGV